MFNGIIYGAGAGLVSSLVMEVGYQLQLRNGRTPVNSADMIDVIKSNTGEIVCYCDPPIWTIIIGILRHLLCFKIICSI